MATEVGAASSETRGQENELAGHELSLDHLIRRCNWSLYVSSYIAPSRAHKAMKLAVAARPTWSRLCMCMCVCVTIILLAGASSSSHFLGVNK